MYKRLPLVSNPMILKRRSQVLMIKMILNSAIILMLYRIKRVEIICILQNQKELMKMKRLRLGSL